MNALKDAGTPESLIKSWHALRAAVTTHQKLLLDNGIGKEVSERDRVRVNARRVGLEAPPFADEAEATFADVITRAFQQRVAGTRTEKAKRLFRTGTDPTAVDVSGR